MCGSMVDIQCATAENRRGNKKIEERKKEERRNHGKNIYRAAIMIHSMRINCAAGAHVERRALVA